MPKRHLQKRAQTVRDLLKSLSANYRNGCPHITEKGVRELVKPAEGERGLPKMCPRNAPSMRCRRVYHLAGRPENPHRGYRHAGVACPHRVIRLEC